MNSVSNLRKIMTMNEYANVFGTPSKEYVFKGLPVRVVKAGNKMVMDKNKPYTVHYKRMGKNFKTFAECLEYISSERYIFDNEMVEKASKDPSFHYNLYA